MLVSIPSVPVSLLMAAANIASDAAGAIDPDKAISDALMRSLPPEQVLNVVYRFNALANFISDGHAAYWTISPEGKDHTILDEVLFKAGARAPLMIDKDRPTSAIRFVVDDFLHIALEEADPEGSA